MHYLLVLNFKLTKMKKHLALFLIIFIFISQYALSQEKRVREEIEIYTSTFDEAHKLMEKFITDNDILVERQNLSVQKFSSSFYVSKANFDKLQNLLPQLGYIHKKNIISGEYSSGQIDKQKLDYLKQQKKVYELELSKLEVNSERYNIMWKDIRDFEKQIYDTETLISSKKKHEGYHVDIQVVDETYDLTSDNKSVSWVNMPGGQFVYFMPENPTAGISRDAYMGYSLKYLFTRGKSYAGILSLKSYPKTKKVLDGSVSELFMLYFGQDFYSRYLGRGKNKFFNLYTGYSLGFIYETGDDFVRSNYSLAPSIGLELFKNKYLLIDTKADYFVPFRENKELRGVMFKASLNFVF